LKQDVPADGQHVVFAAHEPSLHSHMLCLRRYDELFNSLQPVPHLLPISPVFTNSLAAATCEEATNFYKSNSMRASLMYVYQYQN
jgi:hypothetical protein